MINPVELRLSNYAVVVPEADGKNSGIKKGVPEIYLINGIFQESKEMFRIFGIGVHRNAEFDTTFDRAIALNLGEEILGKLKFKKKGNDYLIEGRENIKLLKGGKGYALFAATEKRDGLFGILCRLFRIPITWVCLKANIRFVHDLQNIWYALTGETLEIDMLRGKTFEQLEKEEQKKLEESLKQDGQAKKTVPKQK